MARGSVATRELSVALKRKSSPAGPQNLRRRVIEMVTALSVPALGCSPDAASPCVTAGVWRSRGASNDCKLQSCGLGEVDAEALAAALVAPGHLGARMTKLLLDVALVDLGRGGEAGAQRMAGELLPPLRF
jgi:hypothetical protein